MSDIKIPLDAYNKETLKARKICADFTFKQKPNASLHKRILFAELISCIQNMNIIK